MWQFENSVTAKNISKEKVWAVWSDVPNWNKWDDDIESSSGAFTEGSTLYIKPKKGPRVTATMAYKLNQSFTVTSSLPLGTTVEFVHYLSDTPEGLKITHGIKIQGPLTFLFKYVIGKSVQKNLPRTMEKLMGMAASI